MSESLALSFRSRAVRVVRTFFFDLDLENTMDSDAALKQQSVDRVSWLCDSPLSPGRSRSRMSLMAEAASPRVRRRDHLDRHRKQRSKWPKAATCMTSRARYAMVPTCRASQPPLLRGPRFGRLHLNGAQFRTGVTTDAINRARLTQPWRICSRFGFSLELRLRAASRRRTPGVPDPRDTRPEGS
jgi:hypothetical protein